MDRLNAAVTLMPADSVPDPVCQHFQNAPDSICRNNGKIYLRLNGDALCCVDSEDGYALLSAIGKGLNADGRPDDGKGKDIWYRLITSKDNHQTEELAAKHGIEKHKRRTVILFQLKAEHPKPLYSIFRENAPIEEDDHPVNISHNMLALVKNTSLCSEEEIAEYAAAVIDTMVSEGFPDLQAGIGTEADSVAGLQRSFDEARNALLTGNKYHANENLFRYSEQKLDRMIEMIPPENRKNILRDFYSRFNTELFNGEMLETIRVFFRHDLNITSASRQLFIHRNTLNYRLDKIKRDTGLDLRTFQDAVIFRLIFEMAEKDN